MTTDRDFKNLVRARMDATGENYTAARAALIDEQQATYDAARADHERVVGRFFVDGRLTSIPVKRKVRAHILLELVSRFAPGRSYAEREVNKILGAAYDDYAFVRRELVNYGYLERADGIYRLPASVPRRAPHYQHELPPWEAIWLPEHLRGAESGR